MIIDSPGLADPTRTQIELWTQFVNEMFGEEKEIELQKDGITCIIIPVMIPIHGRVEEQTIQAIVEALSLLTVLNPSFD